METLRDFLRGFRSNFTHVDWELLGSFVAQLCVAASAFALAIAAFMLLTAGGA